MGRKTHSSGLNLEARGLLHVIWQQFFVVDDVALELFGVGARAGMVRRRDELINGARLLDAILRGNECYRTWCTEGDVWLRW